MRHKQIHISLSQSRAWSSEIPIGNPHGGPAYGEKCGPAVAVVGLAMSVSEVAAVGLTLASGLALAGSALGVIGMVTGNQTLGMIGGLMGMGGALANMTGFSGGQITDMFGQTDVGAGLTGDAGAAIDTGVTDAASNTAAGLAGSNAPVAAGGNVASQASTTGVTGIGDGNSILGGNMMNPNDALSPYGSSSNALGQASAADATGTVSSAVATGQQVPGAAAVTPTDQVGMNYSAAGSGTDTTGGVSPSGTYGPSSGTPGIIGSNAATQADPSLWQKFAQWTKDNPELTKMAGNGISEMMKQMFPSGLTKAQEEQAAAYAAYLRQKTTIEGQQAANANNASQLNVNPQVTGNSQTVYANNPQVTTGGILASNRFATSLRTA